MGVPNVLHLLERGLIALGAGCLAVYVGACSHGTWSQAQAAAAFERELQVSLVAEDHNHGAWSDTRLQRYVEASQAPIHALGRLEVPTADVSVMLLEGTDELTLNRAVGHIEGTALPGERGNVGIAGHRDGFFRGLERLQLGDPLSITTLEGVTHYEVAKLEVVEPTAVEVLDPTDYAALTLVTCYPFYYVGAAPQRYIVRAKQVRFDPWR